MGGIEARAGGSYAEKIQQRPVMHPVENAGLLSLQQWGLSGGKHQQVARAPVQPLACPAQLPFALEHKKE